jgi:hypothetical protein
MRGKIFVAALGLLLVSGIVVAISPAQAPGTETIVVNEGPASRFKWIELRPGHTVAGDVQLVQAPLLQPGTTTQVGTVRRQCTVHFGSVEGSRNMLCTDQIVVRGRGSIQADGVIHLGAAPDRLAVVGGTGDFMDVGGTVDRTGNIGLPTITIQLIYH